MNVRLPSCFRGAASLTLAAWLAFAAPSRVVAADAATPPAGPVEPTPPTALEAPAAPAVPATPDLPAPVETPVVPATPAAPARTDLPPVEQPASDAADEESKSPIDRGDFVTIGNDSTLRAGERAHDMVTIMGNALVDGSVRGDCVTVMGNATLNGKVNGDLVCVLGQATLGPGAEVGGQLVCIGGRAVFDPTARVRGEKVEIPFFPAIGLPAVRWINEWIHDGLLWGRVLPHNHAWAWFAAGVFILINLLFAAVFRRPVDAAVSALERRPVMCFVHGLLALLLFGPLVALLSITIVGVLVVPFVVAGFFIAWFTGTIAVYRYSGEQLGVRQPVLAALIVGNVLFVLLYAVPALGIAVWGVTGLVGLGAAMAAFFEGMRRESRAAKPRPGPGGPPPAVSTTPAPAAAAAVAQIVAAGAELKDAASELAAAHDAAKTAPTAPATPPPAAVPGLPAADTLERAGVWPRLGALALDTLFVLVVYFGARGFVPFLFLIPHSFPLVFLAYHVAFWTWRGTTPGGLVLNLRIERLDGGKITPGIATVRALAGIFSAIPGGLGFWWVGWDDAQQSWHDKIAGTTVVRVPRTQSMV